MVVYELRTYSLYVGKLAEARELYRSEGWPALSRHADGRLVGYFIGDVGAMNQIVHLWKFADDADRRRFWETVFADEAFMAFAKKLRPLVREETETGSGLFRETRNGAGTLETRNGRNGAGTL